MPEYPDIEVYAAALQKRIVGAHLNLVRVRNPFLLRTVTPTLESFAESIVKSVTRMGKRVVIGFENDSFLCLHLMVAGRLHWHEKPKALRSKTDSAAFEFSTGTLILTEAGTKKRASLHACGDKASLLVLDAGGLDIFGATQEAFSERLLRSNHTLKRALTDPRILSGIGNAYSDEILHEACLSPVRLTQSLDSESVSRLFAATRKTLEHWKKLLTEETGEAFPKQVTAFRKEMAVHGRYGQPCRRCGSLVQRIRYADNETNYCPKCQTQGKLLADRSLSRLLGKDWPKSLDEFEEKWREWKESPATHGPTQQ